MRKLRTFYGKVTEFLNGDKIPLNKPFIYTVRLVIYANSLPECGIHISSIEFPDLEV